MHERHARRAHRSEVVTHGPLVAAGDGYTFDVTRRYHFTAEAIDVIRGQEQAELDAEAVRDSASIRAELQITIDEIDAVKPA